MSRLAIEGVLPALIGALRREGRAVLQAPPGAGKTTRVPLALLQAGLARGQHGRIVMLEPRRLAVRAAAARLAEQLGEPVGKRVGYRVRGETRVSRAARIEVVTEQILIRMLQSDPELQGVGIVIFDEFHERSLAADLGLALAWEARGALREDLLILVMSATLDALPVAHLLDDAPVITSAGRSFPVETRWLDRPQAPGQSLEAGTADLIVRAVSQTQGGVLAFLPGEREIRRVRELLRDRLPADCRIRPLFGAMPFHDQHAVIAPAPEGRKIVLATAIAETSLTIADIRVVVDAGRARRARFDPASGMSRLVTERVTKAEAAQRRGRAGRVAPGVCYRLWSKASEGGLAPYPPAEIEVGDLAGLALDLALWGAAPEDLAFLAPPAPGRYGEARALLTMLGALDAAGRITAHGRRMGALPLHPRLAHMLTLAGKAGAGLAALAGERDPLVGAPVDLALRLEALAYPERFAAERGHGLNQSALARIRAERRRLCRILDDAPTPGWSMAQMAALAYPDRIGLRRAGAQPRWLLSGGKGASMNAADPLAGARLIVASELDGNPREARIRQAIEIGEAELRGVFAGQIHWRESCFWSKRAGRVEARRQEMFGALVLADRPWRNCPPAKIAAAALEGVRELGLGALAWSRAARFLRARAEYLRAHGVDLPDLTDAGLEAALGNWLEPFLSGLRSAGQIRALDPCEPLRTWLGHDRLALIDRLAPARFVAPSGRAVAIEYSADGPAIAIRLQEMFGLTRHPVIGSETRTRTEAGPGARPLRVTLLSPAGRPLQTTTDLPGFWASSYGDVRKDMRGRYPRHPWPEDPAHARATMRARPRRR